MTMTLYEIGTELEALENIYLQGERDDEFDILFHQLKQAEMGKLENIGNWERNLDIEIRALKWEIARLTKIGRAHV